ncbi:hypothetical protein HMPREF9713_01133 [Myroides odoratimimus CCUG 12700]|nr:hypothetical protein HMPREF9713_01133 [Myroides odoratimimus CCUG 12700]
MAENNTKPQPQPAKPVFPNDTVERSSDNTPRPSSQGK